MHRSINTSLRERIHGDDKTRPCLSNGASLSRSRVEIHGVQERTHYGYAPYIYTCGRATTSTPAPHRTGSPEGGSTSFYI